MQFLIKKNILQLRRALLLYLQSCQNQVIWTMGNWYKKNFFLSKNKWDFLVYFK